MPLREGSTAKLRKKTIPILLLDNHGISDTLGGVSGVASTCRLQQVSTNPLENLRIEIRVGESSS